MSVIYHWGQQGIEDACEISHPGVREQGYVYTSSHIPSLPLIQARAASMTRDWPQVKECKCWQLEVGALCTQVLRRGKVSEAPAVIAKC